MASSGVSALLKIVPSSNVITKANSLLPETNAPAGIVWPSCSSLVSLLIVIVTVPSEAESIPFFDVVIDSI